MRAPVVAMLFLAALTLAHACGTSPDAPRIPPKLELLAGTGITDTISARPAQGLVAQVFGPEGKPEGGIRVEFEAPLEVGGGSYDASRVALSPDGASWARATSATTDPFGKVAVGMEFGTVAGPTLVIVKVPVYGLVDTARVVIAPGAAVGLHLSPHDTTLEVQATFTLKTDMLDRGGNDVTASATYETTSSVLAVNAAGLVTGVSPGRAYVRAKPTASAMAVLDSCGVSVIPAARIVYEAMFPTALQISSLMGTAPRVLLSSDARTPAWSPAHDRIAFCTDQGVGVTDTLGNATMLEGAAYGCWPQYSPDAQWIYFHASGLIRRIHPDGTGVDSLIAGSFPTVAPDGYRLAYQGSSGLMIADVRSRTTSPVPGTTDAFSPRWSPDGQMIAYVTVDHLAVRVIHPDGTPVRTFSWGFDSGLAWSPDSRSILASSSYQFLLLDVSSGSKLPLPLWGQYPAWAP